MRYLLILAAIVTLAYGQLTECDDDDFWSVNRHPDECQRFFTCMLGRRIDFICDPNFIFDAPNRRCRLGSWDTCQFRFGPEPSCEDQFLLFHHREDTCTEFFVCMNGNRVDFSCDPGEIFDVARRRCFPGDAVLCEFHETQ